MAYGMMGGMNPLMYSMMRGNNEGSSIPEQSRPPDFIDMYMKGLQLRSMNEERDAMAQQHAAQAQEDQAKFAQMQQAQTLQEGVTAFNAGGKTWDTWNGAHPGLGNQVQDYVQTEKAKGFLSRSNAAMGILKNLPLTPAGFETYNSPQMLDQFNQLGMAHPTYKNYQEYVDGIQSIDDKVHSVYSAAGNYAGMVRQNSDPNSPYYHKLDTQITNLEQEGRTRVQLLQAQAKEAQAKADQATSGGAKANKPILGAIRGVVGGALQTVPGYTDWANSNKNDTGKVKNLTETIAGAVMNGYGPQGQYSNMNANDAVAAEIKRLKFGNQKSVFGVGYDNEPVYTPSGAASPANPANGSSNPQSQTFYDKSGNPVKMIVVNGQWQPAPQS